MSCIWTTNGTSVFQGGEIIFADDIFCRAAVTDDNTACRGVARVCFPMEVVAFYNITRTIGENHSTI